MFGLVLPQRKIELETHLFVKELELSIPFARIRFNERELLFIGYLHLLAVLLLISIGETTRHNGGGTEKVARAAHGRYAYLNLSLHPTLSVRLTVFSSGAAHGRRGILAQCSTLHNRSKSLPFLPRRDMSTRLVHEYQTGSWPVSEGP